MCYIKTKTKETHAKHVLVGDLLMPKYFNTVD